MVHATHVCATETGLDSQRRQKENYCIENTCLSEHSSFRLDLEDLPTWIMWADTTVVASTDVVAESSPCCEQRKRFPDSFFPVAGKSCHASLKEMQECEEKSRARQIGFTKRCY